MIQCKNNGMIRFLCPTVKYYSMTLMLTVMSVCLSGVLARLAKEQPSALSVPPPTIIKSLFSGPLATLLCVRSIANKVRDTGCCVIYRNSN